MCLNSTIVCEISLVLSIFSATPFSIAHWGYHRIKDMATQFITFTSVLLSIKDDTIISQYKLMATDLILQSLLLIGLSKYLNTGEATNKRAQWLKLLTSSR
jgi:hypothetical protein